MIRTDEDTAVAVELTPGPAGETPRFMALFEAAAERVGAWEVVEDRGYDSRVVKDAVSAEDMAAHIPGKENASEPWRYDEEAYRDRNRVERLIDKMNQSRAVATRYDKLKDSFMATVKTALNFIKVRSIVNRT